MSFPIHNDTWPQLKNQSNSTCILECGTPSSACFFFLAADVGLGSAFLSLICSSILMPLTVLLLLAFEMVVVGGDVLLQGVVGELCMVVEA